MIFYFRGQVYLLLEEMNKSIVDFKRAVELNPNHPIAYAQKLYTDYTKAYKQKAVVIVLSNKSSMDLYSSFLRPYLTGS